MQMRLVEKVPPLLQLCELPSCEGIHPSAAPYTLRQSASCIPTSSHILLTHPDLFSAGSLLHPKPLLSFVRHPHPTYCLDLTSRHPVQALFRLASALHGDGQGKAASRTLTKLLALPGQAGNVEARKLQKQM